MTECWTLPKSTSKYSDDTVKYQQEMLTTAGIAKLCIDESFRSYVVVDHTTAIDVAASSLEVDISDELRYESGNDRTQYP